MSTANRTHQLADVRAHAILTILHDEPVRRIDATTPAEIYTACDTYAELCKHRGLRTVNKLISCIATYNHKHKCSRIEDAFSTLR